MYPLKSKSKGKKKMNQEQSYQNNIDNCKICCYVCNLNQEETNNKYEMINGINETCNHSYHIECLKEWYSKNSNSNCNYKCFLCMQNYSLDILEKIIDISKLNIDLAAKNGDIELVKFLHSIGAECTTYAMDVASQNGHLEVVKFLHSIGAKCTRWAMNMACIYGHLEVIKFLHSID